MKDNPKRPMKSKTFREARAEVGKAIDDLKDVLCQESCEYLLKVAKVFKKFVVKDCRIETPMIRAGMRGAENLFSNCCPPEKDENAPCICESREHKPLYGNVMKCALCGKIRTFTKKDLMDGDK